MDDDAAPVGSILAVSIVVFLLGANLGWNLHLSTSPDRPPAFVDSGLLMIVLQALLLLVTVAYVVATFRLANTAVEQMRSTVEQSETAQNNFKVARETLDFYREQHEKETRPVIFANIESISGARDALELKDRQIAVYNFSKQPTFLRYGEYSFENEDNRRVYFDSDEFRRLVLHHSNY